MINFRKITPLIFFIIIVATNTYFWEKILIPYDVSTEVVGFYSVNNYNSQNDTIRFLIFIFLPLIFYCLSYLFINKIKIRFFFNQLYLKKNEKIKYKFEIKLFLIILFLSIIIFLSRDLPFYKLDIFHEGQLLSGSLNFFLKDEIWQGSYLNTGLFHDQLNATIAFNFFSVKSVGAYRAFQIILEFMSVPFILLLCISIGKNFEFNLFNKKIFIIFLSVIGLYLLINGSFNYRHIPIFLFLFLLNEFFLNPNNKLPLFFLGILSFLSFLWSVDVAAYINLLLLIFILFLIINLKIKKIYFILFGYLFSLIIVFLLVGKNEFIMFFENTINIYKHHEMLNGIIHPSPFSDTKNSSRATKVLVLFLLNGIFIFHKITNTSETKHNFKIFILFFYLLSIFNYKTGLSRSDGGHIQTGASFNIFLFSILCIEYFLTFIFKKDLFIKKIYFFSMIFLILFTIKSISFTNNNSLGNIKKFKPSITELISKDDDFFLNDEYIALKDLLIQLTIDQRCFQAFNYEPAIYYLINKKSCTKYYNLWSIGSNYDQQKFVSEIKSHNSKFILINGLYENWSVLPPKDRFPIIYNYIGQNYKNYLKIGSHNILILVNN